MPKSRGQREPKKSRSSEGTAAGNGQKRAEKVQELQNTIAQLRDENATLRRQLLRHVFPEETAPPFDPAEYQAATWAEIRADLESVENE